MNDKVIFLDVDGVLNSASFFKRMKKEGKNMHDKYNQLDPIRISYLKELVDSSSADIVLSSSWRKIPCLETALSETLEKVGLSISDKTEYISGAERGDEIQEWLNRHPEYTNFVVLDDDSDMTAVRDHHVQTCWFDCGLTMSHVEQALKILRGE